MKDRPIEKGEESVSLKVVSVVPLNVTYSNVARIVFVELFVNESPLKVTPSLA